ncbi:MAG: hypothetical protein IPF96_04155 [Rhodobacter sp.]|nr:hypothetical protein [Rhodobacter sp.]
MSDDFGDEAAGPDDDGDATVTTDAFAIQRQRVADMGGFMLEMQHHVLTWLPGRGERLVVSYDNLAAVRETEDRIIWGQKFLMAAGHDVLGLQIKRRDWYRDREVITALEDLRDDGFFRRFPAVSMYGSSMGGFGALAFAPLAPGCTVMAFAPQRSLDPALCPFESRYRHARLTTDWSLPFGDAAEGLRAASRAYIAYDPTLPDDVQHAKALAFPNVTFLPMRHMGHKLPPGLLKMGLLKTISQATFEARLEPQAFARLMRARRDSIPWRADFLSRCKARGHYRLGLSLAEKMMADRPHWKIRHQRRELAAALKAARAA